MSGARDRSIVIVGAGMAGLFAGCYARLSRYKAMVPKTQNVPGGLCAVHGCS